MEKTKSEKQILIEDYDFIKMCIRDSPYLVVDLDNPGLDAHPGDVLLAQRNRF